MKEYHIMATIKSFALSILIVIAGVGLSTSSAHATVTFSFNSNGQLSGAQNIDLGDLGFFDVTFLDGSCADKFNQCDENIDFDFQNEGDAILAAAALAAQVFQDIGTNSFDTDPGSIFGCGNATQFCETFIPFESLENVNNNSTFTFPPDFRARTILNFTGPDNFLFTINTNSSTLDSTNTPLNFARFITTVPLPPAVLLFGTGLVGLAGLRRQRKAI